MSILPSASSDTPRLTAAGIEFGELARCLAGERHARELRVHVAADATLARHGLGRQKAAWLQADAQERNGLWSFPACF